MRAVDVRDQFSDNDAVTVGDQPRIATGVTVTPPANIPPVASFTYTCNQNVCTFDGRGSTDENPTSLTYAWNFGTQGTGHRSAAHEDLHAPPGTVPGDPDGPGRVDGHRTPRSRRTSRSSSPSGNTAPVPTFAAELPGPDLLGEQPGHGRPQHR